MVGLVLILTVMVAFDLAALRWGADTRPSINDEPTRTFETHEPNDHSRFETRGELHEPRQRISACWQT